MPRGHPLLNDEQKQQIISRIKEKGERVSDLAQEYGVVPKTIYNLLTRKGENSALEVARLKKENEALLKIIGRLVADQKQGEKK